MSDTIDHESRRLQAMEKRRAKLLEDNRKELARLEGVNQWLDESRKSNKQRIGYLTKEIARLEDTDNPVYLATPFLAGGF